MTAASAPETRMNGEQFSRTLFISSFPSFAGRSMPRAMGPERAQLVVRPDVVADEQKMFSTSTRTNYLRGHFAMMFLGKGLRRVSRARQVADQGVFSTLSTISVRIPCAAQPPP